MNITFYKYLGNPNKILKDIVYPSQPISFQLKESKNLMNLSVIITSNDYTLVTKNSYNYCYIDGFIARYYFITDIVFIGNNLIELVLKCDVLKTYSTQLLNMTVFVERSENLYNEYITDPLLPLSTKRRMEIAEIGALQTTTHFYLVVNSGGQQSSTS